MAGRDYYEVLGVDRRATQEQIRAAYRRLARQWHPDVNQAPEAQERFAEIQAAYDVLGEPGKRAQYDRFGRVGVGGAAGHGSGHAGHQAHYAWTNVGGRGGQGAADFDLEDLGSMFDAFFGRGHAGPRPGRSARPRSQARARQAVQVPLEVPFETMALGGVQRVAMRRQGRPTTIEVTIPRGVADGAKLRVPGQGGDPDLILTVRVLPHPLLRREGRLDLAVDLPLTYAEAALGTEVSLPAIEGTVQVTVPPGTRSGKRLRLRGRGLRDDRGASGDLYALVQIVPPSAEAISRADAQALERMSRKGPGPRPSPPWPEAQR